MSRLTLEQTGRGLARIWDQLRFALLVHRTVADVGGHSVELSAGFDERARSAFASLADADPDDLPPALAADRFRRRAVLAAYLGDVPASEVKALFERALAFYRETVVAESVTYGDEFNRILTSLDRSLTLRSIDAVDDGTAIDASPETLNRVGLRHLRDVLRADRIRNGIARHVAVQGVTDEAREDPVGVPAAREAADLVMASALAAAVENRPDDAASAVRRAVQLERSAFYGVFDQTERHLDGLFFSWAAGRLSATEEERLDSLDRAVSLIEEVRGGWRLGGSRSDPLWAPFETIVADALERVCTSSAERSGWLTLRMMEAMRRRHLAGMLRSGVAGADPGSEPSPVLALTDLVRLNEAQQVIVSNDSGGSAIAEHGRALFHDDEEGSDDVDEIFENLRPEEPREALAVAISDFFADAFLPSHVSTDELGALAAGRHVLEFILLDDDRIARCWVDPHGDARSDVIRAPGLERRAEELELLAEARAGEDEHGGDGGGGDVVERARSEVSGALLPDDLCRAIASEGSRADLVVVPDGWLGRVAWGALESAPGRVLVESADTFVVPALSLCEAGPEVDADASGIASCVDYSASDDWGDLTAGKEIRMLSEVAPPVHRDLASLFSGLSASSDRLRWAYVACHGVDPDDQAHVDPGRHADGGPLGTLGIELVDDTGERRSLLDVMAVPWPAVVVFAACFTARISWTVRSGTAPLGLAVAALSGGAHHVLGGTRPVETMATSEFFVGWPRHAPTSDGFVPRLLGSDEHPARLLAETQREWIHTQGLRSPDWGRFIVVTARLPQLRS